LLWTVSVIGPCTLCVILGKNAATFSVAIEELNDYGINTISALDAIINERLLTLVKGISQLSPMRHFYAMQ
jgi:hypothetical protein